ncbi:calpain family cysteine protease [Tumebacillus sp. BK434]|uniref:C2 family cysteine protease n=1 Tax=Tumebacillus sp. BK434 TaxID=2512169 RepID=UPI0010D7F4A5|nr:C2 family cysteine protease [Tumebacillus sp. BK434]TCP59310.1 calpain family cysteine protease [Tumebacillus sp. BK434]
MRTTVPKGSGPSSQARPVSSSAQLQQASGAQQLLLQMQRSAGNQKTAQFIQNQMPIQRVPAAWTTWSGLPDAAEKGTWGRICALADAYSKLQPAASGKREQLLLELNPHISKWQQEFLAAGASAQPEVLNLWAKRASALNDLLRKIGVEWKEMDGSGTLVPSLPEERVANPELSKKKEVSDKVHGGFFSTNERILDETGNTIGVAKKGYLCEYEESATGPSGLKADDFYKVRPSAEMIGSKNYLSFKEGYVLRTAVAYFNTMKQDAELYYEKPEDGGEVHPLFPHPPKPEDVKQGYIGDCYLLAAVLGLVNKSPQLITDMMRDNGNGTVTVKLYDVESKNGAKTFTAREITLEKSVVRRNKGADKRDEHAQGSLWVQMLEKAYAAAGYYGTSEERVPLKENTVEQIAGGFAWIAYEHLTGHAGTTRTVQTYDDIAKQGALLMYGPFLKTLNATQQIEVMKPDLMTGIEKLHKDQNHVYPEEIEAFLIKSGVSKPTAKLFRTYIEGSGHYSGKRGTGKYSQTQLDTYNSIKHGVDNGHPMAISSNEKIASPKKGIFSKGHSGGEEVAKGLVGRHAYAVLGYRDNGGVKEIKLRNPWGRYGRKYNKAFFTGKLESKEMENGEFWLDLTDLTKRFHTLHSVALP